MAAKRVQQVIHVEAHLEIAALVGHFNFLFGFFLLRDCGPER